MTSERLDHSTMLVYSVRSRKKGGTEWITVGKAFLHLSGPGLNVEIYCPSRFRRLVLVPETLAAPKPSENK